MHGISKAILFPFLICLSAWLPSRSPAAGNNAASTLEDDARVGLAAGSKEFQALERSASEKFRRHDYRGAEADCTRLIEIFPRSAAAYVYRGIARRHGGDLAGAAADFDRAIALDPDHTPRAYQNRGNMRQQRATSRVPPPTTGRR